MSGTNMEDGGVPYWWAFRDVLIMIFFFNDTATTEIYTLSLHDALPISCVRRRRAHPRGRARAVAAPLRGGPRPQDRRLAYSARHPAAVDAGVGPRCPDERHRLRLDPRPRCAGSARRAHVR